MEENTGLRTARHHVLAILPQVRHALRSLELADAASSLVGATMAAAYVASDPVHMMTASAEEVDLQLLRQVREGTPDMRAAEVLAVFNDWKGNTPNRAHVSFIDHRGSVEEYVKTGCGDADLIVVSRAGNLDVRDVLHELLFTCHKLVLVPAELDFKSRLARHIVIGWKTSTQVYEVVKAARDWLLAADKVTVVCVDDFAGGGSQNAAAGYFAELGIACEVAGIRSSSHSVGPALVDFCKKSDASCLVAGAFHHGYLAEIFFGRVTYHLLAHAEIPLMLRH